MDLPSSETIRALQNAGIVGGLLAVVIIIALLAAVAVLYLRNRQKSDDKQNSLQTAMIGLSTQLTNIVGAQQLTISGHDQQLALMTTGLAQQNSLLTDLKDESKATGRWMRTLHSGIVDGLNEHSTALGVMGDQFSKQVTGTEANILAHIDTQAQRIVNNATESHSNLKQFISERTKSIEDLFGKITSENEDLVAKVELRDDTIASLQSQLTTANEKLRLYEHPEPPTPVLVVNGTTGETEKQEAK